MTGKLKLTDKHRAALAALASAHSEAADFAFLNFAGIARRAKAAGHTLPREDVRRTVRHLARKGLATFGRGLCTEDGEFAGSGYAITDAGMAAIGEETAHG